LAKNLHKDFEDVFALPVAIGKVSGDPDVVGDLPVVLLTSRDAAGNALCKGPGGPIFDLQVNAVNDTGASAVAWGQKLYYTAADPIPISKKASGSFFGYALGTLNGGANGVIHVLLATQENAGDILAIGSFTFHVDAADIANGDLVTNFKPGFAGKIIGFSAVCSKAVTTAGKSADLNLEIGADNVTGGVIALNGVYALGELEEGGAITGANEFEADGTISIEAANVTAFTEGAFDLIVIFQR
jgi:hypothetical protein